MLQVFPSKMGGTSPFHHPQKMMMMIFTRKNPMGLLSSKPTKAQDSWSLNERRLGEILVTWGVGFFHELL